MALAAVQLVLALSRISSFVLMRRRNVNNDKTHELILGREAPSSMLPASIDGVERLKIERLNVEWYDGRIT